MHRSTVSTSFSSRVTAPRVTNNGSTAGSGRSHATRTTAARSPSGSVRVHTMQSPMCCAVLGMRLLLADRGLRLNPQLFPFCRALLDLHGRRSCCGGSPSDGAALPGLAGVVVLLPVLHQPDVAREARRQEVGQGASAAAATPNPQSFLSRHNLFMSTAALVVSERTRLCSCWQVRAYQQYKADTPVLFPIIS